MANQRITDLTLEVARQEANTHRITDLTLEVARQEANVHRITGLVVEVLWQPPQRARGHGRRTPMAFNRSLGP